MSRPEGHHDAWGDQLGAYLLGALDDAEREEFEAHMRTCEMCRRDAASLRVAADALPASPVQLPPPPELKDRIMSTVRSEASLLQAAGAQIDEPGGRRRWSLRPALAAAAVAGALALGALAGLLAGSALRDDDGPSTGRTVVAEVEVLGGSATLIVRPEHSTLVARGLPRPGTGRVYQVWLKRPGAAPEPTNALFGVRPDGSASVDVPGSLDGVEAVLVTSEPDGGSPEPTRAPIISATPA